MKDVSMPLQIFNELLPFVVLMLIYIVVVRRAVRRGELNERESVIRIRRVALGLVLGAVLLTILSKQKPDAYNALEVAVEALAIPMAVAYAVRELRRAGWRWLRAIWHWVILILGLLATRDLFKRTSGNPQLLAWMVTGFAIGVLLIIVRWDYFFGEAPTRTSNETTR